jgi:branched-chain amino acid transport system permease protein
MASFTNRTPARNYSLIIGIVLFLFLIPVLIRDPYIWGILVLANIYAALGASFDLLMGYTGLGVIGFGLFVGVGGYASAFFNLSFGTPPWVTMPLGGLIGAFFGLMLGISCLRLRGLYLAFASFASAAICEKIILVFHDITNGFEGLSGIVPFSLSRMVNYYGSLTMMLATAGFLLLLVKSRTGLIIQSIRNDQEAAEAVGINTTRYKLVVFLISSFLGGFWGAFMTHYMTHVGPEVFGIRVGILIIMITIVGGMRTVIGSIGGAYLLIIMNELLREIGEFRLLIYSLITIIIFLLMPEGIVPGATQFVSAVLKRGNLLFNRMNKDD